ncbi:MAG: hypothetical protein HYX24_05705 [Candidatus Aenigmarchaeota archaeon]|nr:hypothetical protein [Candidatus Aenigmarchaeota archaeon]
MQALAKKCDNCGKKISGKGISRLGKNFHDNKCMHEYGKKHPPKNPNVCEFC